MGGRCPVAVSHYLQPHDADGERPMRIQFINSAIRGFDGYDVSWGMAIEVENYADRQEMEWVADGWSVHVLLGRWGVWLFSEAGFQHVYGDTAQYYGKFSTSWG